MSGLHRSFESMLRLNELDDTGNPRTKRSADIAYRSALILSTLLLVAHILETVFVAVVARGGDDIQNLAWSSAPLFSKSLLITFIVFGLILNPLIFYSIVTLNREAASAAFYFSLLTITLNLFVFIFLQMRGNGLVVISSQGDATLNTLSDSTLKTLVKFSQSSTAEWLKIQNEANDCCGLNFKTCYSDQVFDITDFDLNLLLSSDECSRGRSTIDTLKTTFPTFSQAAQDEANKDALLSSDDFFCERSLAGEFKTLAQNMSIIFGLQVFFQVLCLFFVGQMLYTYQESEGGLKNNEADLAARPKVENTVLVKAGYEPSVGKRQSNFSRYTDRTIGSKKIKF